MKHETRREPETAIHRQVAAAREGREPRVIARLFSGWVLLGEQQFLRGYTLLLPDPVVPTLNALGAHERSVFLLDVARLGDAVLKVTGADRINYAILGNLEPALHAHIIPRYANEPEQVRTQHPWAYDWNAGPAFDRATHRELAENLRKELTRLGVTKPMRFDPGQNAGQAQSASEGRASSQSQPAGQAQPESQVRAGQARPESQARAGQVQTASPSQPVNQAQPTSQQQPASQIQSVNPARPAGPGAPAGKPPTPRK